MVRSKFQQEIRQDVLEHLVPKHFSKKVEEDNLQVVGQPSITDVHFHPGEPLRFKAEFEVAPQIELGEYRGITVEYSEPVVTEQDVEERFEKIRDQKADYVNVDPRPIESGDYAVISLQSTGGVEPPVEQDELMLHIGAEDTFTAFTENLLGATPDDQKDFSSLIRTITVRNGSPERPIDFHATVKAIRRKELPEANDEFARDLGDYQTLDELKDTIRTTIFREREIRAQNEAKDKIVGKLVENHDFPVPKPMSNGRSNCNSKASFACSPQQGIDPRKLNLDWQKIKESHRPRRSTT